jgi:hypothetical protein
MPVQSCLTLAVPPRVPACHLGDAGTGEIEARVVLVRRTAAIVCDAFQQHALRRRLGLLLIIRLIEARTFWAGQGITAMPKAYPLEPA